MNAARSLRALFTTLTLLGSSTALSGCEDGLSSGGNEAHGSVRATNNTGLVVRMTLSSHGGSATTELIQQGGAGVFTNVSEGGVTVVAYNEAGARVGSAGGHVKGGQRLELAVSFGDLRASEMK